MADPISAIIQVKTDSSSGMGSKQQEPEGEHNLKRTNRLLNNILGVDKLILAQDVGGLLAKFLAFFGIVKAGKVIGGGLGGSTLSGAGLGAVAGGLGASFLGLGGIAGAAGFSGIKVGPERLEKSVSDTVNEMEGFKEAIVGGATNLKTGLLKLLGFSQRNEEIRDAQVVLRDAFLEAARTVRGGKAGSGAHRSSSGSVVIEGTFQGDVDLGIASIPTSERIDSIFADQTIQDKLTRLIITPPTFVSSKSSGGN